MRVGVVGLGAVGARAARQLASTEGVESVLIRDLDDDRAAAVAASLGPVAEVAAGDHETPLPVEVVVLAGESGVHGSLARTYLEAGVSAVSTSDDVDDVRALLRLHPEAIERGRSVVAGAAFAPGLTCLLAAHAGALLDQVDEIHVAHLGTGGPACARQHHRAFRGLAVEWHDRGWRTRPAASGRELCWFPDPIGAADCYRAALADPLLLAPAFPTVGRVTSRLAATRRDRLTGWLPMLRPPHPEGGPGAVRVELRGRREGAVETVVLGAMDRPAVAAGAVAALAAVTAARGELRRLGAGGLAELVEPLPILNELARRGVKAAVFDGAVAA
ncbi:MAG TPA: Gfo/Idh/MocA family oxidoreductase [Acidimicrobiales bacterium]|jgi:saccharopine dehydrogenase-like NADP-dependent oxidoreductase|nr:Gfo/Idh/MocA family oxidoreductase [Acidimicrobiales bacterium]